MFYGHIVKEIKTILFFFFDEFFFVYENIKSDIGKRVYLLLMI